MEDWSRHHVVQRIGEHFITLLNTEQTSICIDAITAYWMNYYGDSDKKYMTIKIGTGDESHSDLYYIMVDSEEKLEQIIRIINQEGSESDYDE